MIPRWKSELTLNIILSNSNLKKTFKRLLLKYRSIRLFLFYFIYVRNSFLESHLGVVIVVNHHCPLPWSSLGQFTFPALQLPSCMSCYNYPNHNGAHTNQLVFTSHYLTLSPPLSPVSPLLGVPDPPGVLTYHMVLF